MGGNLVKLIFSCISTGSGWADLRKNAADSLKNMGQLSGMLKSVAIRSQKEIEAAQEASNLKISNDKREKEEQDAADLTEFLFEQRQRLEDATARANAAHDVLGNAAGMDQGDGLSDKRREWMNNTRFANGAIDLIGSGKIRRGPNGEWVANGRLSNLNQAILDRLNADENKKKLENENDKVVRKLDELIRKLEQMSTL